jgi:hypothetical protein
MADIEAKCIERDCGATFTITAGEQEFFTSKGYAYPKRCKTCRQRRKAESGSRPVVAREPAPFIEEAPPVTENRRRQGRDRDQRRRRDYNE